MIIDFSKYSSIKIGAKLQLSSLDEADYIIGGANNILMSERFDKKVHILGDEFDYITPITFNGQNALKIGAKTNSSTIFKYAYQNNLNGFECLRFIPGTLGGLIFMNAGLKGFEISDNLAQITIFKNGKICKKNVTKNDFAYRKCLIDGVILEGIFYQKSGFDDEINKQLKFARNNQPKGNSFGSVFKNPPNNYAAKLIQDVGLKGLKKGNVGFSDIHSNFMINYGGGSFDDAIFLIELARRKVFENFGINLDLEVKILK